MINEGLERRRLGHIQKATLFDSCSSTLDLMHFTPPIGKNWFDLMYLGTEIGRNKYDIVTSKQILFRQDQVENPKVQEMIKRAEKEIVRKLSFLTNPATSFKEGNLGREVFDIFTSLLTFHQSYPEIDIFLPADVNFGFAHSGDIVNFPMRYEVKSNNKAILILNQWLGTWEQLHRHASGVDEMCGITFGMDDRRPESKKTHNYIYSYSFANK